MTDDLERIEKKLDAIMAFFGIGEKAECNMIDINAEVDRVMSRIREKRLKRKGENDNDVLKERDRRREIGVERKTFRERYSQEKEKRTMSAQRP